MLVDVRGTSLDPWLAARRNAEEGIIVRFAQTRTLGSRSSIEIRDLGPKLSR